MTLSGTTSPNVIIFSTFRDMGTEHNQDQKKCREIFPGKLICGGTCDPIGVDIVTMRHEEYERRVHRR